MNLEDQIRSSARSQVNRYHPADDLIPRIEQRRRQRVARRITASSIAAVVLFGGGALTLSSLRDRGSEGPVADSTSVTIESTAGPTVAVTTVPTEIPPTSVTVTTSPTVPTATTPSTPPPPSDANVPMPFPNADGSTGLSEFWNVPQYGSEAVRGSGCGSSNQLGDTIPDGLWAGFITDDGSDGIVGIDIVCIYHGSSGRSLLTSGTGTLLTSDPEYLIVNNNTRARMMPMDANVSLRLSARDAATRCVDSTSTTQWSDIPPDRQVWIRIHGGRITWIIADCPPE